MDIHTHARIFNIHLIFHLPYKVQKYIIRIVPTFIQDLRLAGVQKRMIQKCLKYVLIFFIGMQLKNLLTFLGHVRICIKNNIKIFVYLLDDFSACGIRRSIEFPKISHRQSK